MASPQSPVPAVVGSPALDRLQADLDAQRKALQDLEARTRAQAEVRKAALSALQSELDARRQADERATAEERTRLSAASAAVSAAQGRVEQERQRLAAVEAERARLAEQAEKLRREQEARRQAEAAKPVIPPGTEKRVALVMGNARYTDRPLRNPVNDSALMARTLQALGFEVQVANDVDRRGMLTALRDFENRSRGADVALFYFAGHGAQVGGANYLIPVNAGIRVENDVPDEAIDAASVLRRIEDTRVKVGLVVLDACRDNPYPGASRSTARGLARMSAPTGTIVAYATAPGSTADDGSGDNGTYTAALARHLAIPGLDIKEIFDRTAQEVERVTNGKQRPREEVGLRGRFALLESASQPGAGQGAVALATASMAAPAAVAGVMQAPAADADTERTAWDLVVRRDTAAGYEAYLRAYPQGRYVTVARVALETFRAALAAGAGSGVAASSRVGTAGGASAAATGANASWQPGEVFKDCAECPEMVVVPAGRFLMGSTPNEAGRYADEGPQRWVDVPRFAMGKFEVTQREWEAVMGSNPSSFNGCGPDCPVENVSWNDAQEFVRRLSQRTGKDYRLPSEAQWEYAARAGTTTAYFWGDAFDSGRANNGTQAARVGRNGANPFGLHDMHGNVWEWVHDVWHGNYAGAPGDGSAWVTGGDQSRRVLRGGSLNFSPQDLRSAVRARRPPDIRNGNTGFRIAMTFGERDQLREQLIPAQAAGVRAPGTVFRDCAECPEMVVVPPGRFEMGSPASEVGREEGEGPVREVRIGYTLAVGRHEVTRREFGRFVAATGYRTEAERDVGAQGCAAWSGSKWEYTAGRHWRNPGFDQGEDHPVVCVSWNDAQAYLRWFNESAPGRGYRLLSEAEWEYVARAGRGSTRYPWGNDEGGREQCAWANGADATARMQITGASEWTVANCSDGHAYTAPVGKYRANAFALYDLHGNAWEWVQDVLHENYAGAPSDGLAWVTGGNQSRRVLRGGSWIDSPQSLRSAYRYWGSPDIRDFVTGFRIARTF